MLLCGTWIKHGGNLVKGGNPIEILFGAFSSFICFISFTIFTNFFIEIFSKR